MTTHELKCWPEYFSAILDGSKTFEVRKNDRQFCAGDELWLREYEPLPGHYTGREVRLTVTYVMDSIRWGVTEAEHVVMGFRRPSAPPSPETGGLTTRLRGFPWVNPKDAATVLMRKAADALDALEAKLAEVLTCEGCGAPTTDPDERAIWCGKCYGQNLTDATALGREQAEAKLAEVTRERDEAVNVLTEAHMLSAGPAPEGGFALKLTAEIVPIMATAMAHDFKKRGGKNYVEHHFYEPTIGPFTITMQRIEGKTPDQLKREAEAALAEVTRQLDRALESAHEPTCPIRTTRDGWDADCGCARRERDEARRLLADIGRKEALAKIEAAATPIEHRWEVVGRLLDEIAEIAALAPSSDSRTGSAEGEEGRRVPHHD